MNKKVLLLADESMGRGDSRLGRLLMANFLRLLPERKELPRVICCVNSGVRLATEDSISLNHMKRLQELGVSILLCKTCLEYFEIEEKVLVGTVSNMMEIQGHLLSGEVVAL